MNSWVDAAFPLLAARVGGLERRIVAAWLELAASVGLTPARGPLAHDLLLPTADRLRFGINVFGHAERSQAVRAVARDFALRLACVDAFDAIADALPDKTSWSGGFVFGEGTLVLKLYFTGPIEAARAVGLEPDPGAIAWGVDLTRDGPSRARAYRPIDGHVDVSWVAKDDWLNLPDPPGVSHRVLASLGESKRSLAHIFGPEAHLVELFDLADEVAAIDPVCSPSLDRALISDLAVSFPDAQLRPVAYEIDLYADGSRATDAFVSFSE